MKAVAGIKLSVVSSPRFVGMAWLLLTAFGLVGCGVPSIPNLEETDCLESRDRVREFYSFHFGNDMSLTEENILLREKYFTHRLTNDLLNDFVTLPEKAMEYFTAAPTDDLPKAFRVGECKVVDPGEVVQFDVLMFWKDDVRTEQKHVSVSLKKENDSWLIDSVSPLDK